MSRPVMACSFRHKRWCSSAHALLVDNYRNARFAWEDRAEVAALGYGTEKREYSAYDPAPTFRAWLEGSRT